MSNEVKDKYKMFRNFMVNELGISREDIIEWTKEAIKEEVKKIVAKSYCDIDVPQTIRDAIYSNEIWNGRGLSERVTEQIIREFLNSTEIKIIKKIIDWRIKQ